VTFGGILASGARLSVLRGRHSTSGRCEHWGIGKRFRHSIDKLAQCSLLVGSVFRFWYAGTNVKDSRSIRKFEGATSLVVWEFVWPPILVSIISALRFC